MVELRILGTPSVVAAGRPAAAKLAQQPKRLALLAYLATCPPSDSRPRDKLAALFWPEADARHARSGLSQALYVLRSALGDDALVSVPPDAVRLASSSVWSDVVAFDVALAEGRPEEALALYRGDLLDGLFVSDSPDFQFWLDEERARIRLRASEGAWGLAAMKAEQGKLSEAIHWSRWATELRPADEVGLRRLMAFLQALGDRAAAMRAYRTFADRLEQEFDLAPSAETRAAADRLRYETLRPSKQLEAAPSLESIAGSQFDARSAGPTPGGHGPLGIASVPRPAVVAAAALVLAASFLWGMRRPAPPSAGAVRFTLEFAGVQPLGSGVGGSTIQLAPDGSRLVFLGEGATGEGELHVRPLDGLQAVPLAYTRGATHPFFSPDGAWLGFVAGGEIRKVPLRGGPAITVYRAATNVPGVSWGSNDVIVFATPAGLWRVSAYGGEPALFAPADTLRGERYRWPHVLPEGNAALFTQADQDGFRLAAVSLSTGTVRPLGLEGTSPRFVSPGHLLFARLDGTVLAAPFDPERLRVTGPAVPIADGVQVGVAGEAKLGVSNTGALAYVTATGAGRLVLVDRSGSEVPLQSEPQSFASPRFSPDGQRLAVAVTPVEDPGPDIWVLEPQGSAMLRLTADHGSTLPAWSPDGGRVAFGHKPGGKPVGWGLRWLRSDGTGVDDLLPGHIKQFPLDFTPDGRALVLQRAQPPTGTDLWILSLEGERPARPYLQGAANEHSAAVSPDGRWLAYVSDERGRDEVYIRSFPTPGPPVLVSSGGGREPRWSRREMELFYRSRDGLMAVRVSGELLPSVGQPRLLFDDAPYLRQVDVAAFDVHPEGEQFVMIRRESAERVVVMLNWQPMP